MTTGKLRPVLLSIILLLCVYPSQAQFFLEKVATSFYTDYIITDTAGMKISLPHEVQKCLFTPRFVSLCDNNYLYYSDADTVFEYDIAHRSKREILTVKNGPNTLCGIAWSPDSSQALVLSLKPVEGADIPLVNTLHLITIDGSLPPKKISCPVNYFLAKEVESFPGRDFYFSDNNTVVYKTHLESYTSPGKMVTVNISDFRY
ncbi:MAG: hypothetical protein A2W93_11025 [Bacteroidetes bacterium GWF2_43_63]|nr:MAG: hypothetical protein A2W94_13900 [Bacteroidetes bacterium GWE2_42_42]OFY54809.1 MAG: hypothetical protein A2W93_11025 [Bacteroidetes bacterium GWF2_43_63]HCB63292.1 hypothetical protein [Bacteroidales bacterium]HCY22034.1 hypothetical protein [Bacteroidales bacterium]